MLVVSGSNMSGKSTLLRTVGVNVVLALAGAPVRAQRMSPCRRLAVGATLRVQDSLQAGKSRFFAEITRLKQIVDLAGGPIPVLFLLDELLAGTNSHDRRLGAAGIVQGLVDKGAIGLVTTHDLALAEVVSDLGVHAQQRALQRHVRSTARCVSTTACARASCGPATRWRSCGRSAWRWMMTIVNHRDSKTRRRTRHVL